EGDFSNKAWTLLRVCKSYKSKQISCNPVKKNLLLVELPPKKNDRPRESSRLWYKSNRQDLQNIVSKKKYFKPISRLNRETSSQIEFG
ncbi:MAG: hypothetical protein KAI84_13230, partial [Gammaproteobacteria bacterium]|nr:hypothetical protein [Gammaproteobacteria bacterium]